MDTWKNKECTFIRHQKIGKFELYIYKCAGYYILDEMEIGRRSHNITYGTTLERVLPTYNRCVREARVYAQ